MPSLFAVMNEEQNRLSDRIEELEEENQIFRLFLELNDFDPDEIIRQGKELK